MVKQVIWAPERVQIFDFWHKQSCTPASGVQLLQSLWVLQSSQRYFTGNKKYSKKFKTILQLISHYPEMGKRTTKKNIRVFVVEHDQIFYLNKEETISVLHIWDRRRNPEDLNL